MRRLAPVSACAVLVLTAACARRPAPTAAGPVAALTPSAVDVGPRLVGCTGYTAPVVSSGAGYQLVVVRVLVTPEGTVAPGSAQVVQSRGTQRALRRDPDTVIRAVSQALSCRFEPARRGGQPVAARTTQRFVYTPAS